MAEQPLIPTKWLHRLSWIALLFALWGAVMTPFAIIDAYRLIGSGNRIIFRSHVGHSSFDLGRSGCSFGYGLNIDLELSIRNRIVKESCQTRIDVDGLSVEDVGDGQSRIRRF